jgi:hypothetical protein
VGFLIGTDEMTRKAIDWEAVEIQYRAGIRSLHDIGAEFGVSGAGILKRARKDGWTRDLSARIKAKADAKVSAALVNDTLVNDAAEVNGEVNAQTEIAEATVIEVEAEVQARIRLAHRKDIQRNRNLAMRMLGELEEVTDNRELYSQLGDLLQAPDDKGNDKRYEIYRKVIELPSRIDGVRKLADTLRVLVSLEREAYGIKSEETSDSDVGAAIRAIQEANARIAAHI